MAEMIPGVTSTSATSYMERVPVQKLGQEDFIKILVAQLTTQDPLNPQKDTEFIGQMAQFSALESTKAMQTEIQTLRAHQLIGKTVEVQINDRMSALGTVTAVDNVNGQPRIIVNDRPYSLSDVVRVGQASPSGHHAI